MSEQKLDIDIRAAAVRMYEIDPAVEIERITKAVAILFDVNHEYVERLLIASYCQQNMKGR